MTCEDLDGRLDDYVDGTLPPEVAHEVAAHLAGCAECREDETALRELLDAAAALPREIQPSRDLWAGIAPRLQPTAVATRPWWHLAAAAALLVAASSAVTYVFVKPEPAVAVATPPVAIEATPAVSSASQGADEATFVAATEELMEALEARRDVLAPETRAVVDRNLAAIDTALAEIRAALRKDPGNVELERRLGNVHRRKIQVLQRVVRLSS